MKFLPADHIWARSFLFRSFSESKGDFAIKLEMLVEADAKTGYMATVKCSVDKEER